VVDAYDAMTEDRPYRKGMLKQEAIAEIMRSEGTQFDPEVSKIFIKIISNENILIS
jgi:HD-GYP domain-containing protein (c-di-GMP phosphodiesterase class II)